MFWYRTILLGAVAAEDFGTTEAELYGRGVADLFKENSGEGTYFGANGDARGACEDWRTGGQTVPPGAVRVAMNSEQWFGGAACGTCLEVTSPAMGHNRAFAVVTDLCPECRAGDLDFAENGNGRHHVTWRAVPCRHAAFEYIMQGSNEWYVKVAVRGAAVPVVKVEGKAGGSWRAGRKVSGGFFELTGSQFRFPLDVRLTSYAGETVTDRVPRLKNDALVRGSAQFSSGGGPAPAPPSTPTPPPTPTPTSSGVAFCCTWTPGSCRAGSDWCDESQVNCEDTCGGTWWAKDGEGPSPTPPPTPVPTRGGGGTPAPTPAAPAVCRPWCYEHPFPHWHGEQGAKCLWKRCAGCPECVDHEVTMHVFADSSVSSKHLPEAEGVEEIVSEDGLWGGDAAAGLAAVWLLFYT